MLVITLKQISQKPNLAFLSNHASLDCSQSSFPEHFSNHVNDTSCNITYIQFSSIGQSVDI